MIINAAQIEAIKMANAHLTNAGLPMYNLQYYKDKNFETFASLNDPLPWVVVIFPGTDQERITSEHQKLEDAAAAVKRCYRNERADVMHRQQDGTLTTDY